MFIFFNSDINKRILSRKYSDSINLIIIWVVSAKYSIDKGQKTEKYPIPDVYISTAQAFIYTERDRQHINTHINTIIIISNIEVMNLSRTWSNKTANVYTWSKKAGMSKNNFLDIPTQNLKTGYRYVFSER